MPVALRFCSAFNLILSLIVLLIQTMVLTSYKDVNSSVSHDTGVGILTAIVLAFNGIIILLNLKRKFLCDPSKMYTAGVLFSIVTLIASFILIGVSAATFYGPLSHLETETMQPQPIHKMVKFEDDISALKTLEGTLFGCGVVSVIVNCLSIVYLCLDYKNVIRQDVLLHQRF